MRFSHLWVGAARLGSMCVVLYSLFLTTGCGGGETETDTGNGGDDSPATVTGTLTLPAPAAGKQWIVLIDPDTDPKNDNYVGMMSGTCGSGTEIDYTIHNVPKGTYCILAMVRVVSTQDDPVPGDFVGCYGATFPDWPTAPNAVVPETGTRRFDITLGEEGAASLQDLAGTWLGVGEMWWDEVPFVVEFTINDSGKITRIEVDGTEIDTTADLTQVDSTEFSWVDSDGKPGRLVVDGTFTYMCFWDLEETLICLQKGAGSLPTYGLLDVVGDWTGHGCSLASDGAPASIWAQSLSVVNEGGGDLSISGTADGGVTLTGSLFDASLSTGSFYFDYQSSDGRDGELWLYLSPDKSCAGVLTDDFPNSSTWPDAFQIFQLEAAP